MTAQCDPSLDAVIIGAGIGGMHQLYRLREKGLSVRVIEAGSGVGGTWYWNRYPGARTDSPAHVYQYWFSDELLQEWDWAQRYPAQEESERYLNYVTDKFDLRREITFNTRVEAAHWDDAAKRWSVRADSGEVIQAQFLISCAGIVSAPIQPPFKGYERFQGRIVHTARWPKEGIDLAGKRVGVVGTGATGIQVVQTVAGEVARLVVFQRTPNYSLPMKNVDFTDADRARLRARYPEIKEAAFNSFVGFDANFDPREAQDVPKEERLELYENLWQDGSLMLWFGGFKEVFFDPAINEEVSEFVRAKIRARIHDPKLADKLVPKDHGFGTRRVPLETNYYEAFNRANVDLVDVNETPILELTESGVRTTDAEYPLDVLILATGFDAGTGALTRIDIRGRRGISLKEEWARDLRTTMGLQIHGFPNLFTIGAPFAPTTAFCNAPTCLQLQGQWIADCVDFVRQRNFASIEPTEETERRWIAAHDQLADLSLVAKTRSWYTGTNVEGKKMRLLSYLGGVGPYRLQCEDVKSNGYEGFALA